jgi:hypothetical protein
LLALTGSPSWGNAEEYPWTTGLLIPYTVEAKAYAALIAERFPDGAEVAVFVVNNEFGQVYAEAFKEIAPEYGITIVDEQTIEATDSAPPVAQVNAIAAKAPDAVLAVPLGAGCASFLSEVAAAKAANAGWAPEMYLTNTCSSSLILGLAGAAADGLYTSNNLVDVLDPETAALPAVAEYLAFMESLGKSDIVTTATAGWHAAEMTVAILKQAQESGVLSRASIINAARNFDQVGSLTREGVRMKMAGVADQFIAESLQVVQYDADTKLFTDIGELITEFESGFGSTIDRYVRGRPALRGGPFALSVHFSRNDHDLAGAGDLGDEGPIVAVVVGGAAGELGSDRGRRGRFALGVAIGVPGLSRQVLALEELLGLTLEIAGRGGAPGQRQEGQHAHGHEERGCTSHRLDTLDEMRALFSESNVTMTSAIHTSAKPMMRLVFSFSWYTSQPSRKLMIGTEYCIGPRTVRGSLCDAWAKSSNGIAVMTPVRATRTSSVAEAERKTEFSCWTCQATRANAGTTRTMVSEVRLSRGDRGTCRFRSPYTDQVAAIARAYTGSRP